MEQADRHPEDDLLERERDKLRDELTQAMWNKAVELQRERDKLRDELTQARETADRYRESLERLSEYAIDAVRAPSEQPVDVPELEEQGKLRDELTQARQDAERDRNALEATYKRQQELEKERDQAHEATDRRMQMLEEVDRERRRRKESCLWCNGVAAHDSSCAYLKEKRAYDSPKACPPELRDAENKAPYCPACGAATPDGGPCLRCAEYAIDAVRAPSDVPKMPSLPTAYEDREYYWTCLDIAVRWLLAEHDEKQRILRRAERENP